VVDDPGSEPELLAALAAKYAVYATRPPRGPALVIRVGRWNGWSARG
jgi:hypothetical protein